MLIEQDALWEYQFVANDEPADPEAVVVPVADWLGPSVAPYGTLGGSLVTNLEIGTAWATGSGLWVRRALTVDGQAPVLLRGQIENACYVYIDGVFAGAVNVDNVQVTVDQPFEIVLPKALLTEGLHELAILCLDEPGGGGDTTLFWLVADYLPAFLPLWPGVPLGETIAWLNDVQVFEDGSEEAERLRVSPRHQYRMECYVPHVYQPLVVNTLWGARASQWVVPVWSQVQNLGAVAAGELTLAVSTIYSEYRPASLLLLWQSPSVWQVIGIHEVEAAVLTLSGPTEAFDDAWVMPVRRGFLEGDPGRAFNGRTSRVTLTFNIEDNAQLVVAAPEQYLGNDIYYERGLLDGGSTNEAITTSFELVDEALGLVQYGTPWINSRPARQHRMMGDGAEEAWGIREWLHRRAGRLNSFWQPSFETDMRVLSTGALTTALLVATDDYLRWAQGRSHIAVETAAGWLPRAVETAVETAPGVTQLTLSSSLAINASAILQVCFLGRRRLNSDRVEINWIGGTACSVTVPVLDIAP